jgi:cell wall-associated NlpC family hydrolase
MLKYFIITLVSATLLIKVSHAQIDTLNMVAKNTVSPEFNSKQILDNEINKMRNDSVVRFAKKFLGTRYRYGGMSPTTGFDCSGFVNFVYLNFGIKLPRSSRDFAKVENKVSRENCGVGDVMVFAGGNPSKRPIGHVAIIISTENNDIEFIHASTRSKNGGIIITKLSESEYYKKRLVSIVRI